MCGIAGWIDWQRDLTKDKNVRVVKKMGQVQAHRGPDDSGEWIAEDVALAHRRLVVIDLDGGKQPMVKEVAGNKYVLVYNGELYNAAELRAELKKLGYKFKGHSDTEVLLTAYIQWGEKAVQKLNGIFAFAVWDINQRQLYLARDRIGVKPLFYVEQEGRLIFASELKGILAHPEVEAKVGRDGLAEVLGVGPGRTPGHGVFKGIKELKPGCALTFNQAGVKKERYWKLESRLHKDDLKTTITKVRSLFVDTVKRQLISDMPVCTLLSGGLDSSAITAIASNYLKEEKGIGLASYSVDYKDNQKHFKANHFQPETDNKWIKIMSDYAETDHYSILLDNTHLAESLKEGVYARDLPGMADIDTSLNLFSKQIKEDFTVALSGECADEIFGGYPWYYNQAALNADTFPWSRKLNTRLEFFKEDVLAEIEVADYLRNSYQTALSEVPKLADEDEKNAQMREMFYLNLTRWMPTLLDRKDRMSMYTGLEIRVPFCDHRLVEYLWNIPWEMKNYGGQRKGILRAALKGLLPEKIRTRPKNPYPKTSSPAYFNSVKNILREILADANSPIKGLIEQEAVLKLMEKDKDFNLPWFGQLMRLPQFLAYLIQLNIWLEEYNVQIVY